ncbi:bifunctional folylpolyglutamate synthase/dihydrofolate synthase [Deinococcus sp. VB343]|uniref:bifunctional folylpolyglutamate synthase/dihydrofolate synthase n=1 Tax=Deinococcus sp. VB343 TaxID=3385567 RepID=UPI0039C925E7
MLPPVTQSANVDWLFARQRFGIHPGLTRVRALLARLGDPQQQFQTVLVGGTNGKGSTAASLDTMLRTGGRRTALFTSPHLTRLSERFVVDGQDLSETVVLEALERVRLPAEETEASFFEVVTALGCLLFAEAGAEWAVMEVGLGGRLDATNALDPVLSILTNVALDHTAILGDTPEQIAQEKAGILRPGRPAVTALAPELLGILDSERADLWALGRDWQVQVRPLGWAGHNLTVTCPLGSLTLQTPLLGEHGAHNAAVAAVAAWRLGLSEEAIREGAAQTRWPGRLEVVNWAGRRVLLDGAHNPVGAQALAEALRPLLVLEGRERLPLIFGAAEDKDLSGVVAALAPLASEVILTRAELSPRAAHPEHLAPLFRQAGVERITVTAGPAEALAALSPSEPLALACGSLYLLGELRPLLLGEASESHERWQ